MQRVLKLAAMVALNILAITAVAATPKMPTFFARRDYPGLDSYFVQVADTNGDGIPDLIANEFGYIEVLFGNGNGTFRPGSNSLTSDTGSSFFVAANLTGSGTIDLALASGNGVVVCVGNGNGTFQSGVLYPISDDIQNLALGDFNGDGILDIVATGNSGIWLLTGQGGGTYNAATLVVSLPGAFNIAVADFKKNGHLDLAVTLPFSGTSGAGFAVLLGNGNGTFQTCRRLAVHRDRSPSLPPL